MTKYLAVFLSAGFAIVIVAGAFNYLTNPFGLFNSPLDLKKTQAYSRGRILKAHQPLEQKLDALLVGNSRVELGLSPSHPALKALSTYNIGLPGADISMQSHYAFNVIKNQTIKDLVMSVDFVDFLFTDGTPYRHPPSTYTVRLKNILDIGPNDQYMWHKIKDKSAALFSLDALTSSFTTILSQNSQLSYMQKDGKMHEGEFFRVVENEGINILFKQKRQNLRAKFEKSDWLVVNPETRSSLHFKNFKSFISEAIKKKINLSLFISPLHESYIEILRETDKLDLFNEWKILLVQHLQEINFFQSGQLWDFSVASEFTSEALPKQDKKGIYMSWYWEPAHYRSALGDKILDTLLLAKNPWGKQLTPPSR